MSRSRATAPPPTRADPAQVMFVHRVPRPGRGAALCAPAQGAAHARRPRSPGRPARVRSLGPGLEGGPGTRASPAISASGWRSTRRDRSSCSGTSTSPSCGLAAGVAVNRRSPTARVAGSCPARPDGLRAAVWRPLTSAHAYAWHDHRLRPFRRGGRRRHQGMVDPVVVERAAQLDLRRGRYDRLQRSGPGWSARRRRRGGSGALRRRRAAAAAAAKHALASAHHGRRDELRRALPWAQEGGPRRSLARSGRGGWRSGRSSWWAWPGAGRAAGRRHRSGSSGRRRGSPMLAPSATAGASPCRPSSPGAAAALASWRGRRRCPRVAAAGWGRGPGPGRGPARLRGWPAGEGRMIAACLRPHCARRRGGALADPLADRGRPRFRVPPAGPRAERALPSTG